MRRLAAPALLAALGLVATLAACGQYGPPRRADSPVTAASVPAVAAAELECTDDEEQKP